MLRALAAVALLLGCRGGDHRDEPAPASTVPKLPRSRDGVEELRELDHTIARYRAAGDPHLADALLARAAITGRLDDYVDALADTERRVAAAPDDRTAWRARALALARVHRFAAARDALAHVDAGDAGELAATLDDATGRTTPYFERAAQRVPPDPRAITRWAASLAAAGRVEEARALIPKAAAAIHDNPATLVAWLLFQWGRIHEQEGALATARDFYAEAHRRLPGYLEATVHLAQTMRATGGDPTALVATALADNRHPELLALAGQVAAARTEWERYIAALPEAFADHAARFYLGPGADPARALALARLDRANRDVATSRALVVEAALAAGDAAAACDIAPLVANGTRPQQFLAWRAYTACNRRREADALAAQLGIR